MALEKKIEFLWEGAKIFQSNNKVHQLLKSYYTNTCRKLCESLKVPKEKFSASQMCPYCSTFWNDSEYSLKLIPKQIKSVSKARNLLTKLERDGNSTSSVINKRKRKRAKWLRKKMSNHLAIRCYQCKHTTLLKMETPNFTSREKLLTSGKKGFSIESESSSIESSQTRRVLNCKKSQEDKRSKRQTQKSKSTKVSGHKVAEIPNTSSNKFISKTQKQNSLLQLAALLKQKSTTDLTNSSQKRMQSFLK